MNTDSLRTQLGDWNEFAQIGSKQSILTPQTKIVSNVHGRRILLLSTSLLVDRVFRYTGLIDQLSQKSEVDIWTSSSDGVKSQSSQTYCGATAHSFPAVRPFRELRHNFVRRLNEYVWDYRYRLPSRMSMMKHRRDSQLALRIRALKVPARFLSLLRTEALLEKYLEKWLLAYPRSEEAEIRLRNEKPDVIVSTGPFQFEQPAIFSAAKKLNIPTIAYIPSWDNISTKNRMVFNYDGYIVWNEKAKKELHEFYPQTKLSPVYVVGAPQFDLTQQQRFFRTREEFCAQQNLDPNIPIIVYAVGSPNFLMEHHGALRLAKRIDAGELGNVQLLVRPHPIHDNAEMKKLFEPFKNVTRLQTTPNAGKGVNKRSQDENQVVEWINTFRHADVVVNLSSTVTIDAAIFDTPVVNLDFDPQPGQADQQLIKEINHEWTHFKPIAESGGVYLVNDFDEMVLAIKTYIANPELHRDERRWIVEYVCGFEDGKCGERMADAILDFVMTRKTGN
ncbi:MAG: hypothetical protein ACRD6X_11310 [Pyrinomonadaceae bacterium]